jgi:hypothetical protein
MGAHIGGVVDPAEVAGVDGVGETDVGDAAPPLASASMGCFEQVKAAVAGDPTPEGRDPEFAGNDFRAGGLPKTS